ncbi:cyclic lactone autoinducer peptide [Paenibacillus sp. FSL R7-0312]|nr:MULTISPECIES: cyclic lactone autoinducer peptide [Paenibacillus]
MNKSIVYGLASCLSVVALTFVSTASILYIHQPKTPSELLK